MRYIEANVRIIALVAPLVVLTVCSLCSYGIPVPTGPSGGTLYYGSSEASIVIPEKYHILDVERVGGARYSDRLLVTVESVLDSNKLDPKYRSEVRLFTQIGDSLESLDFEDSLILVVYDSKLDAQYRMCRSTASCGRATAVAVGEWESARPMIFDQHGHNIPVTWPQKTPDGGYADYIEPIGWQEEGTVCRLFCAVFGEGGTESYILIYDYISGTYEMKSMEEAMCEIGSEVIMAARRR